VRSKALTAVQRSYISTLLALNGNWTDACRARKIEYHTVRKWQEDPRFLEELQRKQAILSSAADVMTAEVIGTLASQMRADIYDVLPNIPEVKRARANGVSHLIRKIKVTTSRHTHKDGSHTTERRVELEMVDSNKAAIQLAKLMGLPGMDDELERTRNAIRTCIDLKSISAEEAILMLTPHFPAAPRLRDEFLGMAIGPVIEMEKSDSNG